MNQSKTKVKFVISGLLLAILMSSMDNTIVATAMGTIVGEIGGLDKFVWVTSAYMITEMAGMPIFGKLSDMYGRKWFFVFGLIVFMLGSAFCGMAESIVELSLYRAIQGIGAGALVSIAFTIMLDIVPVEHRGKMMGMFGALFGLSSIAAPLLGGYLTEHLHWVWIFYINLPLGMIALLLVFVFYKESTNHSKQKIDYLGAVLLVGAIVCLMLGVQLGGKQYAWNSLPIIGMFTIFVVFAVMLVFVEKRAAEPIISFGMFKNRLYTTSNLIAMLSGASFITASIFIPMYIQGVLGGSASNAGLVLLPMMVGSVVTATAGGYLCSKFPYRTILIPTLALLIVGLGLLTTLNTESSRLLVTVYMIMVGLGIGSSFSVLSNAAIHSFSVEQRGAATSTLNFNRSLGTTLGITLFGILQSHLLTVSLAEGITRNSKSMLAKEVDLGDPHVLLNPILRQTLDDSSLQLIVEGLSTSIAGVFIWSLIPAVLALISALVMTKEKLEFN